MSSPPPPLRLILRVEVPERDHPVLAGPRGREALRVALAAQGGTLTDVRLQPPESLDAAVAVSGPERPDPALVARDLRRALNLPELDAYEVEPSWRVTESGDAPSAVGGEEDICPVCGRFGRHDHPRPSGGGAGR